MKTGNAMSRFTALVGLTLLMTTACLSRAAEYTWSQTASGTYSWTNATNWGGSGYPHVAGDIANLNNDIAGNQNIQLGQNIAVGEIKLGDSAGIVFKTTIENKSGESYALSLDSGTAGVAAKLTMSSISNVTQYLNAPIVLNSDWTINMAGVNTTNAQRISFGNTVNIGSKSMTFIGGIYDTVSGVSPISFAAGSEFTGTGSIINNSYAAAGTDGKKNFSGKVILSGWATGNNIATLTITTGAFTNAAEMVVNGYLTDSNVRKGAAIHEGYGSGFTMNPGQRFTYKQVTLNGGQLTKYGQPATVSTTNDWGKGLEWDRDDINVLSINSGYNYLSVNGNSSTAGGAFFVKTLKRRQGASLYLFGPNGSNKVVFIENSADFLLGTGSGTGTARKIIPWIGTYLIGNSKLPSGFTTYEASTGLRTLNPATEYATSITAGADQNVSVTDVALTSDTTVNSLRCDFSTGKNIGQGRTLTVTSGGIFFASSLASLGSSGNAAAGTLNFGSAEGVISAIISNTNTIGAAIAGSGGLTKAQTGALILTGANTFTGSVNVGGGLLRVGDGTYASNLGSGKVTVHAGAKLRLSCSTAIANHATVQLFNLGPDLYFGKMEIDAGLNETVRYLYLGDQGMPAGTYGGTGSGAEHILPNFFSGTGILTASDDGSQLNAATTIIIK